MPDGPTSRAMRNYSGLKGEPARLVRFHFDKLPQTRTAAAVLDWLDEIAGAFGLQFHGIWEVPTDFKNQIDRWCIGTNAFLYRKVPKGFWERYKAQHRSHGPSANSFMARLTSEPFTFAEAAREAKRRRWRNAWVFDVFRDHGFPDGLYCTSRRWAACFVSPTQVVLGPHERSFIQAASLRAFGRLERLKRTSLPRKRTNGIFTETEKDVMQARALEGSTKKAAAKLGMNTSTLLAHLKNARKRLGTNDTIALFVTALKVGVIDY